MSKAKITMTVLSMIAAAGMTACSSDNNNSSSPETVQEESAEAGPTAQELLAEREKTALASLTEMKEFGAEMTDENCAVSDIAEKVGTSIPYMEKPDGIVKPMDPNQVIQSKESSLPEIKYAAVAVASRVGQMSNSYCMARTASGVSKETMVNHGQKVEGETQEQKVEKLEAIVSAFSSKFDLAKSRIELLEGLTASAKKWEQSNSRIAALLPQAKEKIERIDNLTAECSVKQCVDSDQAIVAANQGFKKTLAEYESFSDYMDVSDVSTSKAADVASDYATNLSSINMQADALIVGLKEKGVQFKTPNPHPDIVSNETED